MTERIRLLAEQAGMLYDGLDRPIWAAMDKVDMDNFLKDFYHVVVQECLKINEKELSFAAYARLYELYDEHFGIENERTN